MNNNSNVNSILVEFVNEVKNQFKTIIKIIWSNNACEFLSIVLLTFSRSLGIVHQTSYAHTSQQNGVAKRKHSYILDGSRTLLIYNNVPSIHWGNADLTATYLINRITSTPLNEQIPLEIQYPKIHFFVLPPKIFGCVASVHLLG